MAGDANDPTYRDPSQPVERRVEDLLARMTRTIPLGAVPEVAPDFLAGKVQGRTVVDTRA